MSFSETLELVANKPAHKTQYLTTLSGEYYFFISYNFFLLDFLTNHFIIIILLYHYRLYIRTFINYFTIHISASLGALALGCSFGYSSPAGAQLTANTTDPNALHLTSSENAWFSSFLTLGLLIGALCGGFFIKKIGHKKTMIYINIPYVLSWVTIGKNYIFLFNIFKFFIPELLKKGGYITIG